MTRSKQAPQNDLCARIFVSDTGIDFLHNPHGIISEEEEDEDDDKEPNEDNVDEGTAEVDEGEGGTEGRGVDEGEVPDDGELVPEFVSEMAPLGANPIVEVLGEVTAEVGAEESFGSEGEESALLSVGLGVEMVRCGTPRAVSDPDDGDEAGALASSDVNPVPLVVLGDEDADDDAEAADDVLALSILRVSPEAAEPSCLASRIA
jgi:hypothetical protein